MNFLQWSILGVILSTVFVSLVPGSTQDDFLMNSRCLGICRRDEVSLCKRCLFREPMRFGKRKDDFRGVMRFGKRPAAFRDTMRFGKRKLSDEVVMEESAEQPNTIPSLTRDSNNPESLYGRKLFIQKPNQAENVELSEI